MRFYCTQLTVEFYKCFWDFLGPKVVEVGNKIFDDQELTNLV